MGQSSLEYHREYYSRTKERRLEQKQLTKAKTRQRNQALILAYLKENYCVDCGEKDPLVLEFDHLDENDKFASISNMVYSYSWNKILEEIKKCEVRCANCHRRKTAKQFGWLSKAG